MLGTDHFIHLRIIQKLKVSDRYLLNDVFTFNEKYCFYPFLFHWLLSKLPNRIFQGHGYKKINLAVNILRLFFFNIFCLKFDFLSGALQLFIINVIFITFPFSYLKWNAINTGLSARGFGLLLGEVYLYLIFIYFFSKSYLIYLIICFFGVLFFLGSQFATQFFILSNLFFTIYNLDLRYIFIPITSLIIYFVAFNKVAIDYFYGQFNHKRNYLKFFLKTHFNHRKSFYRDFIFDFWKKILVNPKEGVKYFLTNPFVEVFYGFNYLIIILFFNKINFFNPSSLDLIILSGIFCFLITTFKLTRFLGEPQRYLQFIIPFVSISFASSFHISFTLFIVSISIIIIIIFQLFYYNNNKINKSNKVDNMLKIKNIIDESDSVISNDPQGLKVLSAYFEIFSYDLSQYLSSTKEFYFFHPKNYITLSVDALNFFKKRYNPSILILNSKLYNKKEIDFFKKSFPLRPIYENEEYFVYRIR